jgi:hypothetical protein
MKLLLAASTIAACLAGAAFAQLGAEPDLDFELLPVGQDYARAYPPRALRAGQEGVGILCCTLRADRTLACESRFEAPAHFGFGAASVAIAGRFRVTEESYAEFQASPASRRLFRRVIAWNMEGVSPEWRRYMVAVREQTVNICEPEAASAPAPSTTNAPRASPR